jgi:hypothetical protein
MSNPFTKKNPPQYVAAEKRALAATGHSKRGIAAYFGVSVETFERWMDEDEDLREAFANGRENERHALHNSLYVAAIDKGNPTAAMFLLKARHGYREGDQAEQGNKVSITFNLPGAMTAEQYKTIEAVAGAKPKRVSNGD